MMGFGRTRGKKQSAYAQLDDDQVEDLGEHAISDREKIASQEHQTGEPHIIKSDDFSAGSGEHNRSGFSANVNGPIVVSDGEAEITAELSTSGDSASYGEKEKKNVKRDKNVAPCSNAAEASDEENSTCNSEQEKWILPMRLSDGSDDSDTDDQPEDVEGQSQFVQLDVGSMDSIISVHSSDSASRGEKHNLVTLSTSKTEKKPKLREKHSKKRNSIPQLKIQSSKSNTSGLDPFAGESQSTFDSVAKSELRSKKRNSIPQTKKQSSKSNTEAFDPFADELQSTFDAVAFGTLPDPGTTERPERNSKSKGEFKKRDPSSPPAESNTYNSPRSRRKPSLGSTLQLSPGQSLNTHAPLSPSKSSAAKSSAPFSPSKSSTTKKSKTSAPRSPSTSLAKTNAPLSPTKSSAAKSIVPFSPSKSSTTKTSKTKAPRSPSNSSAKTNSPHSPSRSSKTDANTSTVSSKNCEEIMLAPILSNQVRSDSGDGLVIPAYKSPKRRKSSRSSVRSRPSSRSPGGSRLPIIVENEETDPPMAPNLSPLFQAGVFPSLQLADDFNIQLAGPMNVTLSSSPSERLAKSADYFSISFPASPTNSTDGGKTNEKPQPHPESSLFLATSKNEAPRFKTNFATHDTSSQKLEKSSPKKLSINQQENGHRKEFASSEKKKQFTPPKLFAPDERKEQRPNPMVFSDRPAEPENHREGLLTSCSSGSLSVGGRGPIAWYRQASKPVKCLFLCFMFLLVVFLILLAIALGSDGGDGPEQAEAASFPTFIPVRLTNSPTPVTLMTKSPTASPTSSLRGSAAPTLASITPGSSRPSAADATANPSNSQSLFTTLLGSLSIPPTQLDSSSSSSDFPSDIDSEISTTTPSPNTSEVNIETSKPPQSSSTASATIVSSIETSIPSQSSSTASSTIASSSLPSSKPIQSSFPGGNQETTFPAARQTTQVATTIQATSLVSTDPSVPPTVSCVDGDDTFDANGAERNCEWLAEQSLAFQLLFCRPNRNSFDICQRTCRRCP